MVEKLSSGLNPSVMGNNELYEFLSPNSSTAVYKSELPTY